MNKIFHYLKAWYCLFPLMLVTLVANFVGFVIRCQESGFLTSAFLEFLILATLYVVLGYALIKNHWRLFAALVLVIFAVDSLEFWKESANELVAIIQETEIEHYGLQVTGFTLQLLASLLTVFALVVYILEIYTNYENESLFTWGKSAHCIAALICILVFVVRAIWSGIVHEAFADLPYTVAYTFAPLTVLSLSLNVQEE